MPGNRRSVGGGVYVREHQGKTVTFYPKSHSTGEPTLRYPASDGKRESDKIRYY